MDTQKSKTSGDCTFVVASDYNYFNPRNVMTKDKCVIAAQKEADGTLRPAYVLQIVGVCNPKSAVADSNIPVL